MKNSEAASRISAVQLNMHARNVIGNSMYLKDFTNYNTL